MYFVAVLTFLFNRHIIVYRGTFQKTNPRGDKMNTKPLVVLLERSNDFHSNCNFERDILAMVLRQRLEVDVLVIESWLYLEDPKEDQNFNRNLQKLKEAQDSGRLIGIIMATNELDLANGVKYLQKETPGIPLIFVEARYDYEELAPQDKNADALNHEDPKLQDWVKTLADKWLGNGNIHPLPPVDENYQSQLEKINSLTNKEKAELSQRLLSQNRGKVSLGHGVKGFAIHTTTLEWQISEGYGLHSNCVSTLGHYLEEIIFKHPEVAKKINEGLIIFGLVFRDPPDGFSLPVIVLYNWDAGPGYDMSEILELVAREHGWLPLLATEFDNS